MRVGSTGHPFALDFGAIMQVGAARGADAELLGEVLPIAELAIVTNLLEEGGGDGG
ncbi:DUF7697 family protein [Sphingomonas sp.]|uniref:DUF7697 family protein n=1 Tax=Sphingomonas sp. TaxID=28214 RepID=UPI003B00F6B1